MESLTWVSLPKARRFWAPERLEGTTLKQALNLLLEQRLSRRNRRRRISSVVISVVVHLGLIAAIALAPALAARDREPIEFVQVQIVPLQALGVPDPVVAQPTAPVVSEPKRAVVVDPEPDSRPVPAKAVKEEPAAPRPETRQQDSKPPAEGTAEGGSGGPAQRRGSPFGSALATSPFGTAVAGFDNPDFVYGYYVDQMLAMIGSNWVRPAVSDDVEMTIHFRIMSDGKLTDIEVVAPSGDSSFDLAGLRAVQLASPLPPLPRSFPHESLGVNLIIR